MLLHLSHVVRQRVAVFDGRPAAQRPLLACLSAEVFRQRGADESNLLHANHLKIALHAGARTRSKASKAPAGEIPHVVLTIAAGGETLKMNQ